MTLRIGEAAERSGVTPRTIRYYEELGLLPRGERAYGKHRLYSQADIDRLQELTRLRDLLGLTLEELRSMIVAEDARADVRRRFHASESAEEQLALLEAEERAALTASAGLEEHQRPVPLAQPRELLERCGRRRDPLFDRRRRH